MQVWVCACMHVMQIYRAGEDEKGKLILKFQGQIQKYLNKEKISCHFYETQAYIEKFQQGTLDSLNVYHD